MTTTTTTIDEVVGLLRQLRLPHMRRHAPEVLATAKAQRWEPAEAIRALLAEELAGRQASSINTRRKAAGFPTGKTFHTWDETMSSIPQPTQRSLATLEWIDRAENLVVCGPSGTGKSHLLEALGHAGIRPALHRDGHLQADGVAPGLAHLGLAVNLAPHAAGGVDNDLDIAADFFRGAGTFLKANGRIVVVFNRHLPYERWIRERFRVVDRLAQSREYTVIQASKPE